MSSTQQQVHQRAWLIMLLSILLALITAVFLDWPDRVTAVDIQQDRLDTALPAPQNDTLTQTFVPRHNGLTELKLIAVKYEPTTPVADGALTLTLRDDRDQIVAEQRWLMSQLTHNQELFLRFPAEPDSVGREYALALTGSATNQGSVWGYRLNVLDTAVFTPGLAPTNAQIMTFTSRYALSAGDALHQLGRDVGRYGGLMLFALIFLFSPGAWLVVHPHWAEWDVNSRWGLALAASLSLWALLWLWPGLFGWHWAAWSLWALVVAGWAVAFYLYYRYRVRPFGGWGDLLLPLLLLAGLALRLVAVRDLTFLPWVDASRHALITAVMRDTGQTIWNYLPYLTIEHTPYHYGFHGLPASLQRMTADFWPLETTLLVLMQLLGALVPLAVYTGGWLLTRRRLVGLLAAFLVAVPFYFPAYYVSWGRLTQLSGVLILPVLLGLSWLTIAPQTRPSRAQAVRLAGLIGLLAGGLFLVHFRVFVFYLPLAVLVGGWGALVWFWQKRAGKATMIWSAWGGLVMGGLLTAVLVAPRLYQLVTQTSVASAIPTTIGDYHAFPVGYVNIGWERYFWAATAVFLVSLLLQAIMQRTLRPAAPALLLAAWLALTLLLTPGDLFPWRGLLPAVNLNSLYIMFFVPQGLFLATAVVALWPSLGRLFWVAQVILYAACGAMLVALLLFGVRQQVNILNEETRLAWPQDQPAIAWVAENVPADAKLAVNSWQWLPNTWASSDGGGWLLPLAQRQTSTPPVDYTFDAPLTLEVMAFNEGAQEIEDWSTAVAADFLRQRGVTHVYVGQKGGFLDPAELNENPEMVLLYRQNGVFVFALTAVP